MWRLPPGAGQFPRAGRDLACIEESAAVNCGYPTFASVGPAGGTYAGLGAMRPSIGLEAVA